MRNPNSDLKRVVYEAIYDLRPYFGISEKKLKGLRFPEVREDEPNYFPYFNLVTILNHSPVDDVGEEVGHWYCYQLNPKIRKRGNAIIKRCVLRGNLPDFDLEYFRLMFSMEYIGRYVGLVLAELRGHTLEKGKKNTVKEAEDLLYVSHDLAESLAESDFMKRGPDFLKRIGHAQDLVQKILYVSYGLAESDFMKRGPDFLKRIVHAQSPEEIERIKNPSSVLQKPSYLMSIELAFRRKNDKSKIIC